YVDTSTNNSTWTLGAGTVTVANLGGFELTPALPSGTTYVRLRVPDLAGNIGTSASYSVVVSSAYAISGQARIDDPDQTTRLPFGAATLSPNTGDFGIRYPLD